MAGKLGYALIQPKIYSLRARTIVEPTIGYK
jgi:hypothetical protein